MSEVKQPKGKIKTIAPVQLGPEMVDAEVSQEVAAPISMGLVDGFVYMGSRSTDMRGRNKVYTIRGPKHLMDQVAELAEKASNS